MEIMQATVKCADFDKNPDLIRRYRAGDRDAGGELAEKNRPLVFSIATRFRGRGVEFEELVEAGNLGLVKAINTFALDRGCAFSTYATPLIFGEIRRFLRDDGMIKVSREQKRLCALLCSERERRVLLGEPTDIASIAAAVGVSGADAASALFSATPVRSLDESASTDDDDARTIADTVFDDAQEAAEFERICVRGALEKLEAGERKLIILRYFRDMSQSDTARVLGLSQVKVSREEKKILAKLRRELS